MQRFHITIILVGLIGLVTWLYIFFYVSPLANGSIQPTVLIIGLTAFDTSITCLLSLVSYRFKLLFSPYCDPRQTTRNCLRQSFWIGGGITFILLLNMSNTLNPITLGLTLVTLVSLEVFFR